MEDTPGFSEFTRMPHATLVLFYIFRRANLTLTLKDYYSRAFSLAHL